MKYSRVNSCSQNEENELPKMPGFLVSKGTIFPSTLFDENPR
jgi:hypothetical protein